MTKLRPSKQEYISLKGVGSHKIKDELIQDKLALPKGAVSVITRLKEPYPSMLMEMYPDLPLGLAVRQFLIDNIKLEELK